MFMPQTLKVKCPECIALPNQFGAWSKQYPCHPVHVVPAWVDPDREFKNIHDLNIHRAKQHGIKRKK